MRLEILYKDLGLTYFELSIPFFSFWFECLLGLIPQGIGRYSIGIRFGNKIYEKRW